MSKATFRDRWISEVLCTPLLTDTVRVALFAMSREMDEEGVVSMSRKTLASCLGRSERKASDRIGSAIEAGYLVRLTRGQKYQDATYRAVLPSSVRETPGGPAEDSQGDGLQHPENRSQGDPRGSRQPRTAPTVSGTPGGLPETPAYKDRAHARSRSTYSNHQNPAPSGTDAPSPDRVDRKISQSARKREAFRWLHNRYGLTEFEAAAVIAEVTARAPNEIRALIPYLAAMKEGDLADIVTAVFDRTKPDAGDLEDAESRGDEQRRPVTTVPAWCGHCDERTRQIELLDGRPKRCPTCHPLRNQETA